ncbi:CpsD/CapB family tyrosine-protein kinase [Anaerosporobacter sp.]
MGDIIEFYCNNSQIMNDAIDRIVVEIYSYKKHFGDKSILLSGCGSKSGTTTTAINLAIALSAAGWKTLLVDCDLRKGSKFKKLNENIGVGLTDYLAEKAEVDKVICETNYEYLNYVPSGTASNSPIRLLCSTRLEEFVSYVKAKYDYIIFDFPSLNIVADANIMFPYVDGIALVASLNQTTKRQLCDARRKVSKFGDKCYGLIVNQVDLPQYKKYIKDYDYFGEENMSKRYKRYNRNDKKLIKDNG